MVHHQLYVCLRQFIKASSFRQDPAYKFMSHLDLCFLVRRTWIAVIDPHVRNPFPSVVLYIRRTENSLPLSVRMTGTTSKNPALPAGGTVHHKYLSLTLRCSLRRTASVTHFTKYIVSRTSLPCCRSRNPSAPLLCRMLFHMPVIMIIPSRHPRSTFSSGFISRTLLYLSWQVYVPDIKQASIHVIVVEVFSLHISSSYVSGRSDG